MFHFLSLNRFYKRNRDRRGPGASGEDIAVRYLSRNGFKIIHRNLRIGRAEFDIVAEEDDFLVFVEVKASRTDGFGDPSEWVDRNKKSHLIKAAQVFLKRYGCSGRPVRFDVVTVKLDGKSHRIQHYIDAFSTDSFDL